MTNQAIAVGLLALAAYAARKKDKEAPVPQPCRATGAEKA